MESQIEAMKSNIENLKSAKPVKEKKKKEKKEKPPVASTSKAPPKQPKANPKKKSTKKAITDDDVLSFEQKKDLSESIGKLDGARLERVIQIIHEGVPEIRDVGFFVTFLITLALTSASNRRAPRKLSSRLINCQRPFLPSSTTTFFDLFVSLLNRSAIGLAKGLARVVSSARAWTRRRRQKRFGS